MTMQPKKWKYRKAHKGKGGATSVESSLRRGKAGLRLRESCRLTARELEAAMRGLKQNIPRRCRIRLIAFPDRPVRRIPIGRRMGKGKGSVRFWRTTVAKGKVIVEVDYGSAQEALVRKGLRVAARKLPVSAVVSMRRLPLV